MNHRQLFALAASICRRQQARRPRGSNYFLSAVALRPDGLLVSSFNVTIPNQRTPRGHAEYRLHSKLTADSIVYVARVKADGSIGLAKPCDDCENVLRQRRVARVYYTISDDEYGVMEFDRKVCV